MILKTGIDQKKPTTILKIITEIIKTNNLNFDKSPIKRENPTDLSLKKSHSKNHLFSYQTPLKRSEINI